MALGGYKFAGYKCSKPSGATDAQWALLIHKTRLKAFMAANTAASAGWSFDWSNGDEAFETYGNVIYYADGTDPLNLVSFFKHGSGDDTKYYMIASLFNYATTAGYSRLVIPVGASVPAYYSSSSAQWKIYGKQLFHAVSYDRFPEDCLVSSSSNYPQKAICLVPIGGYFLSTGTYNIVDMSNNYDYSGQGTVRFGCAIRNKNITSITVHRSTIPDSSYYKITLVGFDSMTLSSPSDTANIYGISLCSDRESIMPNNWSANSLPNSYCNSTLKNDFTRYEYGSVWSNLVLTPAQKAVFAGAPSIHPYESVSLNTCNSRTSAPFLNSDGITSKGTFNIDLLATNSATPYTSVSPMQSYANGNYLLAIRCTSNPQTTNVCQTNYYVGWDPSNPDITSEDAWTAYDGT